MEPNISNSTGAVGFYRPCMAIGGFNGSSIQKYGSIETIKNIVHDIFAGIDRVLEPFKKIVVFKHLVQIVYIPFKAWGILKNCASFPRHSHEKKIDVVLDTLSKVREIGESIGTFIVALETIKAIPNVLAPVTMPLTAALTVLSTASIVIKIRTCIKTNQFKKAFDKAEKSEQIDSKVTLAGYEAMLRLIEERQAVDKTFVAEMFNTTDEKLAKLLIKIQLQVKDRLSSSSSREVRKGQKQLEKVVSSLKGRVKQNIVLTSVSITSSIVNIIGASLLLAMPLLPIGWPLLALGAIFDVGRFIFHKKGEYEFAQAIGLKRTKWEWLTC